jgi:hypothetical protein
MSYGYSSHSYGAAHQGQVHYTSGPAQTGYFPEPQKPPPQQDVVMIPVPASMAQDICMQVWGYNPYMPTLGLFKLH